MIPARFFPLLRLSAAIAVAAIASDTYVGAPTVQVSSSVAFPIAIETIAEGTPERAAFEVQCVS